MSVVTTGQFTIADLNDAVSATLSNETFVAPANPDGGGPDLTGAATTMKVFLGGEDDSANWAVAAVTSSGVTGSLSGKTYTVTGLTVNSGYVDLTASRIGFPSITRRFSLSKARKGNRGSVTTARSIAGTAWSDAEAATAVADVNGDAPASGDMVTLHNSTQKFSQTRIRQSDNSWSQVTEFFGGDVMVKGSVTASKIVVSDRANLIPDPGFDDAGSWLFSGVISDADSATWGQARKIAVAGATGVYAQSSSIPFLVDPGDTLRFSVLARISGGVPTGNGAYMSIGTSLDGVTWTQTYIAGTNSTTPVAIAGNYVVPEGTRFARINLHKSGATNTTEVEFSRPKVVRRASSELIVDGAIKGQHIEANTIKAKHLEIGSRNLTLTGITFEHNAPSTNSVNWTAGSIRYVDDAGVVTSKTITASNAAWTSGVLYIYWVKGATALSTTTNQTTAFDDDNVLLATYEGGVKLDADYGRTIIDGAGIKTGTITSTQIQTGTLTAALLNTTSLSAAGMSIFGGTLKSDDFVAGTSGWRIRATGEAEFESLVIRNKHIEDEAITAEKLMIGDYTNLVPNGMFSDSSAITAHWGSVSGPGTFYYLLKSENANYVETGAQSVILKKNTGSESSSINVTGKKYIPVEGGADYYGETSIRTNQTATTAGAWYRIIWYDHTKTQISTVDIAVNAAITTSWVKHAKKVVAPATASFARVQLFNTNHQTTTNNLFFDRLIFRRANAAELIVDGSIKANHLSTEELITTTAQIKDATITEAKISGTLNANKITAGSALAATLTVSGKALSALKTDAELGASDPVGRINGGSTTINGGKITTGTIEAGQIKAGSLTVDRLAIRSLQNLIENPDFENGQSSWTQAQRITNDPVNAMRGSWVYTYTSASATNFFVSQSNYIEVKAGDSLHVRGSFKNSSGSTGSFYIQARWWNDAMSVISTQNLIWTGANTAYSEKEGIFTAPAGATKFAVVLYTAGVGTCYWDDISVMKAADSKLIVDGAIVADKIGAGAVVAGKVASNAITAKEINITDMSNLLAGADKPSVSGFDAGPSGAWLTGTTYNGKTYAMRIDGSIAGNAFVFSNNIPVTPGDEYYVEFMMRRDVNWNGATANSKLRFSDQTDTLVAAVSYAASDTASGVWTKRTGSFTIPSGCSELIIKMTNDATAGLCWVSDLVLRKKHEGKLIVDGTITASKLDVTTLSASGMALFGGVLKSDNFVANTSGWRIRNTGEAEFESLIVRNKNLEDGAAATLREATLTGLTGQTGNGTWVSIASYTFTPTGDTPISLWFCGRGAITPGSGVYGTMDVRILFRGTERVQYPGALTWTGPNTGRTTMNIADRFVSGGATSGTIEIQAKADVGTFTLTDIRLLIGEFKK